MDDTLFEITPESYLLDCEDLPTWACESKDYCLFGVDTMEAEMGEFTDKIFILGETFVKNFYTVFTARSPKAQVEMGVSINFANQAQIHEMDTSFGTYFFLMFLSFISTGFIIKVKMRKHEMKMHKLARN